MEKRYCIGHVIAKPSLLHQVALYLTRMLKIFGVVQGNDDLGFPVGIGGDADVETMAKPYLDTFVEFRDKIRNFALSLPSDNPAKEFLLSNCDEVRDKSLVEVGKRSTGLCEMKVV